MTVVVLGGTGWVGRHVCAAFARRGERVVAVARNPTASGPGFRGLDLAGAPTAAIAGLLRAERADVVVNAVDSTNTTDGWQRSAEEHERTNARMVERLLAAVAATAHPVRLIHLGTVHEYGPIAPGTAVAETHPPRPVNDYARAKLAGSRAVLAATSVDAVVLRLVNVCGPEPSPASFPGKLVDLLRTRRPSVTVAAARRDFVDVRDVADAVVAASEVDIAGQAINIGSGRTVEIAELARIFFSEAGIPPHRVNLRYAQVPSLGGDWILADITRAAHLLAWRPSTPLRQSLHDMAAAAR
ncbi:NAD(P)-dependent oxidoreductase [Actinophytocola sp.]|uniref:NAD-dependent epimerase/dehydratase family protein n=1 Tax=Actinophytocola sp. TaxID=1872138 RepID=UPI002D7EED68|nr:NAD(P)-dependent oxidoreductase [Actinophytocola sp.]HET9144266.1 NAD(P)-dependent oxidoreductase [Actinophytocola sp.]